MRWCINLHPSNYPKCKRSLNPNKKGSAHRHTLCSLTNHHSSRLRTGVSQVVVYSIEIFPNRNWRLWCMIMSISSWLSSGKIGLCSKRRKRIKLYRNCWRITSVHHGVIRRRRIRLISGSMFSSRICRIRRWCSSKSGIRRCRWLRKRRKAWIRWRKK